MVFLAMRPQNPQNTSGYNQLGRETFLAPVTWDGGWPVVNGGRPITLEMPGLYDLARPKLWRDDFTHALADKGYYTQRTPYKPFTNMTARPGWLRLRGNPYTLSDRDTPAALFRKQVDLETVWSTALDFFPTSPRHEAGATIFLSIWYHNEIAVMTVSARHALFRRRR
jgi:beta-xylosidase